MKDKKMTKNKRRKSVAGGVVKKTRSFIGRVNKKVDMAAKAFRKDWKKGQPKREKYKEELRNTVNKVLENSIKISGDVFKTIKKDLKEINNRNKNKKK